MKNNKQKYLPEFVYGGIDGVVTTFAIIAGAIGASLSPSVILILGFANLFADGFSMASSNYLSRKSETEEIQKQKSPIQTAFVTFVSFIVIGFVPLASFVFATFSSSIDTYKFEISIVLTAIAFIGVGAVKGRVTGKHKVYSAFETLMIGTVASAIAYFVGVFLQGII